MSKKMLLVRGTVEFKIDVSTLVDIKQKDRDWILEDILKDLAFKSVADGDGENDVDLEVSEIEVEDEFAKEYNEKIIDENIADDLE